LLIDGHSAPLGARAFDVLLVLVERRDRTVTKNELLDLVWHGLVVEDNNLQVQISTLRKVLGQNAIATIPGRGYRFTLQADEAEASSLPRLPVRDTGSRGHRARSLSCA
jgi:DNA-binding winged helix-turn-helix (wHTH) protein